MRPSNSNRSNKWIIILVHVLAWALLGFTFLLYQPLSWNVRLPEEFWIKQSMHIVILVGLYYVNSWYFVPKLLLKNKIGAYALVICLTILIMSLLIHSLESWLHLPEKMSAVFPRMPPRPRSRIDGFLIMTSFLVAGISTSVTLVQQWQRDKQLRNELEQQRVTAELSFLKAQINPHFFFNTLNNIYALSFTNEDQSRDALLKLSRMMRYLLYETQHDRALLSKELSFVKDYIELMKMRLHKNTSVVFTGPAAVKDIYIAPMLLLPFIENAFKHGVSAVQETEIGIYIELTGNLLTLNVKNQIFTSASQNESLAGGIGLSNTARRLDLLYPNRHELLVTSPGGADSYTVELKIDLS